MYSDGTLAPPPRNLGCWLTGLMSLAVAIVLVGVAALLPPFSLLDRLRTLAYAPLAVSGAQALSSDGSLVVQALSPAPRADFALQIDSLSIQAFNALETEDASLLEARMRLPKDAILMSAVYSLASSAPVQGAPRLSYSLALPSTASPDLLDLYGYDPARGRWTFIASRHEAGRLLAQTAEGQAVRALALFQPVPRAPQVMLSYDLRQMLDEQTARLAHIVAPSGLQPTLSGAIVGSLAPGFSRGQGYRVMPIVRNYDDPRALDTQTVTTLISRPDLRREHVRQLASLAINGFDGIWIDYRGLLPDQRSAFSAFVAELKQALEAVGLSLGVVIAADEELDWQYGAYDWAVIGHWADLVKLDASIAPRHYLAQADQPIERMLTLAVSQINRHKLLLGLSAQSIREQQGAFVRIGYQEAIAPLGSLKVSADRVAADGSVEPGTLIRASLDGQQALAGVDAQMSAPFLEYQDASGQTLSRAWLTTADALRYRLERASAFALAGAGFDDLLSGDLAEGVLQALEDYRLQAPIASAPSDLALLWRISGSDGSLQEVTTAINAPLVITLDAPNVQYEVNVAVVGVGQQPDNVRQGVAVAVALPTATPTSLPTATPTPTPTTTPTPAPIIPTSTAQPGAVNGQPAGGGWTANRPPPGSIQMSGFEYGGHVTDTGSARAAQAMRRAGMTWMKVQIRYGPGMGLEGPANAINAARANGFKILIGTSGNPTDIANGGEGYFQAFAQWLGGVASLGPDAIEVWNEPNLDREWPTGQISGAMYTSMLRYAYQAIKGSNPSVMVISGAPAPTGAEGAYPGRVVNDDRFLREMVSAGAMNYTDCVGVHYNEGIVPPSATSGDPRDNYYTRYFQTIMNTYWSISGGVRPLCFTELGYVTPEGLPPLPSYFAWGSNVTLAQQAAWLAEAAALSSRSGKVRMMIVWNVDFSYYGTDPMAGFAIIRPDGSCPACEALAAAR